MSDRICCPLCRCAEVLLSKAYPEQAEVLALLREHGPMTASEIRAKVDKSIGVTAINNRLERLRAFELVARTRYGNGWKYIAKPEVES
ncbi:hypothetical protein EON83_12435 [bacterium]|nr:MAG: hypothetical protein EON83_12435 [bacterium]